ncbi:hydantoinase/carbamoylase family amidase [Phytoactinopolyspora limicola]|uniref:hydantoinase/carbamoylase family amidase n=1 Tax=Phytoactinopolyspora limicola TaxID=2715536 RepID=UPI001407B4D8|nr:hydantoinase/carbamoylase family amidase [Phytoactinopolyspora limicola]
MTFVPVECAGASGVVAGWERSAMPDAHVVVTLVHGINGIADEWRGFAGVLPDTFRVIAVDLPGHGGSQLGGEFDLDGCVDAVVRMLRARGVSRTHVLGSSFGGGVALALAAKHPELVRTVATVGTGPGAERDMFALMAAAVRERGPAEFFAETIRTYSYPPGTPDQVIAAAAGRASQRDVDEAVAILEAGFCTPLTPIAGLVSVPRLIIGGAADRTNGPDRVRALAAACSTEAHIVPGLGHLPHVDRSERLAALLRAYWALPVDPTRVTRDLAALEARTRDAGGVQRLCWTPTWQSGRELFGQLVSDIPGVTLAQDAAGNLHATLAGRSERTLVLGSHLDSVPDGGNLDGAYGVMSALEILRTLAAEPDPPALTIRVTDWADEEGARFGRSLFGSGIAAGSLDVEAFAQLSDRDGNTPADVLPAYGVELERLSEARATMRDVVAYLELHIEQGPRLEASGKSLAAVTGSLGVERHRVTLRGTPSHAGGTPMDVRRDPVTAAARFLVWARDLALETGGLVTCGAIDASPGTPTAVADTAVFTLDVRHEDARRLADLWQRLSATLDDICAAEGVVVELEQLWRTDPVHFDPKLVDAAAGVVGVLCDSSPRLVSGPLHDACEMARSGVPTAMLFVASLGGVSHSAQERTDIIHLHEGVRALAALTTAVVAQGEPS